MRMARVNITMPDDLIASAKAAGINVSRLASEAVAEELDRRAKVLAAEQHLADLEAELGPIAPEELDRARGWLDAALDPRRGGSS